MEAQQARIKRLTLTVAEAAETLSVSIPTVYELVHRDGFPSLRVGRKWLVSRTGLETWIASQASLGKEV
jgi:excisionase family DNA binding protein